MNTKYLDINQNLKNSFLRDSLQSKSMIIGRESNEKREVDTQDLKNIHCIQKWPIKTELRLILGNNIFARFQHVDFSTTIQNIHLFTSLSSGRTTLLFMGTINKVANRGRKINNQHTPALYCLLLNFFMVIKSTVLCATCFLA